MLCLRNPEVEVSAELLYPAVMMRVQDTGIRLVAGQIARPEHLRAVEHILIENRTRLEAAQPVEDLPPVETADIRLKKGLDAPPRQILYPLHEGLLRVVEAAAVALIKGALLRRELPAIDRSDPRITLHSAHQRLHEHLIPRHRIIRHKEKIIRHGEGHPEVPARAVIECLPTDVMHLDILIAAKPQRIQPRLLRIHENDAADRITLQGQSRQQPVKFLPRVIGRNDDVDRPLILSFHDKTHTVHKAPKA